MRKIALIIILGLYALALAAAANAQAPISPSTPPGDTVPPPAQAPSNCAQMPPNAGGSSTPNSAAGSTVGQSGEALSDKLAKSDGTLCPPSGVDPEIRAPAPESGNMPVIPPPGSPGGDPSVRPK
jgi:hypothetical protein